MSEAAVKARLDSALVDETFCRDLASAMMHRGEHFYELTGSELRLIIEMTFKMLRSPEFKLHKKERRSPRDLVLTQFRVALKSCPDRCKKLQAQTKERFGYAIRDRAYNESCMQRLTALAITRHGRSEDDASQLAVDAWGEAFFGKVIWTDQYTDAYNFAAAILRGKANNEDRAACARHEVQWVDAHDATANLDSDPVHDAEVALAVNLVLRKISALPAAAQLKRYFELWLEATTITESSAILRVSFGRAKRLHTRLLSVIAELRQELGFAREPIR
jgi:hypothetical protein